MSVNEVWSTLFFAGIRIVEKMHASPGHDLDKTKQNSDRSRELHPFIKER
jgi:hypothetical protein